MAAVDVYTESVRCSGNPPIGQLSKTKINVPQLTAGNFAATITALTALHGAYGPLTLGVQAASSVDHALTKDATYPTTIANRGEKWILFASNATARKFTYTIPAPVETGNTASDGNTADLTSTAWAAFKTAFEAIAVDPFGGALTLDGARLGGRRR